MKELVATVALLLYVPLLALAQNADHSYHGEGYLFYGEGASNTPASQWGGGGEWLVIKGLGLGGELEYSTQFSNGVPMWIGSTNVSYHYGPTPKSSKVEVFVTGGYTFFSVPGTDLPHANGGNFGAGLNAWLTKHAALRLEIRDIIGGRSSSVEYEPGGNYYTLPQNLVCFRIGVTFG
jgi:hypothetical protein